MADKQIIINGKECRYWFRLNPDDYRKCSLRGKNDNCDEIKDCFVKELLGKLALKEQECEDLKAEIKHYKQIAQYHGNLSVKYTNKSARYKQALTKIKDIAEKSYRTLLAEKDCIKCDEFLEQILQKISDLEV